MLARKALKMNFNITMNESTLAWAKGEGANFVSTTKRTLRKDRQDDFLYDETSAHIKPLKPH